MRIGLLFFAASRELAGTGEASLEIADGSTTEDLAVKLLEDYPDLTKIWAHSVMAVNMEYVEKGDAVVLKANDEVAVIPAISGG